MKKQHVFSILLACLMTLVLLSCDTSSPGLGNTPSGPPTLNGMVSIAGTAQVGQTLTAITGDLGGSGTISYQWRRGVNTVIGTNRTYTVQAADVGSTIMVAVNRSGYSGIVASAATATVTAGSGGNIPPDSPGQFFYTLGGNPYPAEPEWVTITGYTGPGGEVEIPARLEGLPVTGIAFRALAGKQLTAISIPTRVTSIGMYAFAHNQLAGVIIPNSVTSIGEYAFSDNQLTSVTIPNGITLIERHAFEDNYLSSVTIPGSVTSIQMFAFARNRLTSVIIPDSVISIGATSFSKNRLTSIIIPNNVTSIGNSAFANNELTSVTISNSVPSIGMFAFANNNLTSVTIPQGVTLIQYAAFSDNSLTSVIISGSVNSIESLAFAGGGNRLTSITIGANVTLGSGSFDNANTGFEDAYNNGGRLAGTYTRPNAGSTVWERLNVSP